jgi:hypothetical protein
LDVLIVRTCKLCGLEKPLEDFYSAKGYKGGRKPQCKACHRRRSQSQVNPHQKRAGHLRRKFGITPDEYDAMSEEQGHVCAVCGRPETAVSRTGKVLGLSVDHDHSSGRIRGLLCRRHNQGLGLFFDDPDLLRRAADYLSA